MTSTERPFSPACENNKNPILNILQQYLSAGHRVLEIGSGTGQHAVFFANNLPSITWQPSDRLENHSGMKLWLQDANHDNLHAPLVLDVMTDAVVDDYHAVYTANTMHIMSWAEVLKMVELVGDRLVSDGMFFVYGPFNIDGQFTSDSNQRFDQHLRSVALHMGIRDMAEVTLACKQQQLVLHATHDMPANNKLLVFKKSP